MKQALLRPPLSRIFRADHTSPRLRRIETEYHLELVVENTAQIAAHQAELLSYQARAAEANLRGMGELAWRQDETNALLGVGFSALAEGMDRLSETMVEGFDNAGDSIDRLQSTMEKGLHTVVEVLESVSRQMWQQQKTLDTIVELLRRPYGTQAQELLREANKWLEQGARRDGRDAMRIGKMRWGCFRKSSTIA